ncbi:hypothetical protein ACWO0W_004493 [Vibrio parahaemolyticus]
MLQELLLPFGGASVVIVGLSAWLGKVWAARIIEAEKSALKHEFDTKIAKLNALNESKIHVSKLQFEREFNTYAELWDMVTPIVRGLQALAHTSRSYEYYKGHFSKVGDLHTKFGEYSASQYPFIDSGVYENAHQIVQALDEKWHVLDAHLSYLNDKAHGLLEDVDYAVIESEFVTQVDVLTADIHNFGVELSKAIKKRNESMLVV